MYKECEARGRSKPRETLDEQQGRNAAVTTSSKATLVGHVFKDDCEAESQIQGSHQIHADSK
eukprot:6286993-Amphidinium_carterae.2